MYNGKNKKDVAKKLLETVKQDHIYIKQDGSLNRGTKIVTPHDIRLPQKSHKLDNYVKSLSDVFPVTWSNLVCCTSGRLRERQRKNHLQNLIFDRKFWDELLRFSRFTTSQLERWKEIEKIKLCYLIVLLEYFRKCSGK